MLNHLLHHLHPWNVVMLVTAGLRTALKPWHLKQSEIQGRYDGASQIPSQNFLSRVDQETPQAVSRFERWANWWLEWLDARRTYSRQRIEALGQRLAEIISPEKPRPLAFGLLFLLIFSAAVSSEVYLIMPTMRGLGIADPMHQMLAATGIVLLLSVLSKYLYDKAHFYFGLPVAKRAETPRWRFDRIWMLCLAVFVITTLVTFGLFRASEMVFSQQLESDSPLGRFLAENEGLTKLFFVCLTVALPVGGAIALWHGVEITRCWAEWLRARLLFRLHQRRLHRTEKAIQSKQERLAKRIHEEQRRGEELKAKYLYGYDHGQTLGARKLPSWWFVCKVAAFAMLCVFVAALFDLLGQQFLPASRWLVYGAFVLCVTGLYAMRQWRIRERPRPQELTWQPLWRDDSTWNNHAPRQLPEAQKAQLALAPPMVVPTHAIGSINGLGNSR